MDIYIYKVNRMFIDHFDKVIEYKSVKKKWLKDVFNDVVFI